MARFLCFVATLQALVTLVCSSSIDQNTTSDLASSIYHSDSNDAHLPTFSSNIQPTPSTMESVVASSLQSVSTSSAHSEEASMTPHTMSANVSPQSEANMTSQPETWTLTTTSDTTMLETRTKTMAYVVASSLQSVITSAVLSEEALRTAHNVMSANVSPQSEAHMTSQLETRTLKTTSDTTMLETRTKTIGEENISLMPSSSSIPFTTLSTSRESSTFVTHLSSSVSSSNVGTIPSESNVIALPHSSESIQSSSTDEQIHTSNEISSSYLSHPHYSQAGISSSTALSDAYETNTMLESHFLSDNSNSLITRVPPILSSVNTTSSAYYSSSHQESLTAVETASSYSDQETKSKVSSMMEAQFFSLSSSTNSASRSSEFEYSLSKLQSTVSHLDTSLHSMIMKDFSSISPTSSSAIITSQMTAFLSQSDSESSTITPSGSSRIPNELNSLQTSMSQHLGSSILDDNTGFRSSLIDTGLEESGLSSMVVQSASDVNAFAIASSSVNTGSSLNDMSQSSRFQSILSLPSSSIILEQPSSAAIESEIGKLTTTYDYIATSYLDPNYSTYMSSGLSDMNIVVSSQKHAVEESNFSDLSNVTLPISIDQTMSLTTVTIDAEDMVGPVVTSLLEITSMVSALSSSSSSPLSSTLYFDILSSKSDLDTARKPMTVFSDITPTETDTKMLAQTVLPNESLSLSKAMYSAFSSTCDFSCNTTATQTVAPRLNDDTSTSILQSQIMFSSLVIPLDTRNLEGSVESFVDGQSSKQTKERSMVLTLVEQSSSPDGIQIVGQSSRLAVSDVSEPSILDHSSASSIDDSFSSFTDSDSFPHRSTPSILSSSLSTQTVSVQNDTIHCVNSTLRYNLEGDCRFILNNKKTANKFWRKVRHYTRKATKLKAKAAKSNVDITVMEMNCNPFHAIVQLSFCSNSPFVIINQTLSKMETHFHSNYSDARLLRVKFRNGSYLNVTIVSYEFSLIIHPSPGSRLGTPISEIIVITTAAIICAVSLSFGLIILIREYLHRRRSDMFRFSPFNLREIKVKADRISLTRLPRSSQDQGSHFEMRDNGSTAGGQHNYGFDAEYSSIGSQRGKKTAFMTEADMRGSSKGSFSKPHSVGSKSAILTNGYGLVIGLLGFKNEFTIKEESCRSTSGFTDHTYAVPSKVGKKKKGPAPMPPVDVEKQPPVKSSTLPRKKERQPHSEHAVSSNSPIPPPRHLSTLHKLRHKKVSESSEKLVTPLTGITIGLVGAVNPAFNKNANDDEDDETIINSNSSTLI